MLSKYKEGTILTFANGMTGCVTKFDTLAMVDKSGWTTTPHNMPRLQVYLENNKVIKAEEPHDLIELDALATIGGHNG